MRRLIPLALLASMAVSAGAAKRVSVEQLEHALTAAHDAHKPDVEIARQIGDMQLSERLTEATLSRLNAGLTANPQASLALRLLADQSAFLDPPRNELPPDPPPNDATQQRILDGARSYVKQTLPRLPNLLAKRTTKRYDDSPEALKNGGWEVRAGLRLAGTTSREASVFEERDNGSPTTGSAFWQAQMGMISGGEFGSTLGMIMADTLKGKVAWGHWEEISGAKVAVFRYSVPKSASHYEVIGTLQRASASHQVDTARGAGTGVSANVVGPSAGPSEVIRARPGYHGSLWIDPDSGSVLRITIESDSTDGSPFRRAAILVQYGPVQIGGDTFVCPLRSVALTDAVFDPQAIYADTPTRWLNETLFTDYRRFGSTSQVLTAEATPESKNPPGGASEPKGSEQIPGGVEGTAPGQPPVAHAGASPGVQSTAGSATEVLSAPATSETSQSKEKEDAAANVEKIVAGHLPVVQPSAPPEVQSTAQQAADSPQASPTIVVNVNRVLVPVVVRDKQGRVVTNLTKEDFQVFDDDRPHPVSAFAVERRRAADSNAGGAQPPPPASASTPQSTILPNRIVVFLFDDLHLTFEDLSPAQKAAVQALTGVLVGSDMAAVISTSGKINSGLTRDRAKLQDSILAVRPHAVNPANQADCPNLDYYRADLIENKHDGQAIRDAIEQLLICEPQVLPGTAERIVEMAARRVLEAGQQDVQATYAATGEFVRRMAHLPGQRTMVLVSSGFIAITPEALAAQSQLIDLAAQSSVTISTLDARGLYTVDATASENTGTRNPQLIADYRRSALALAANPLEDIADGTGGSFFHNNNDLAAGLKSLTAAPECVYVLELSLDGVKPDGLYHRLKVKVDREGLQVQARRGYYSARPDKS